MRTGAAGGVAAPGGGCRAPGEYGPNRLREAPKATLLQRFLQQLRDPMLLILMAAAAVSAVTNYLSHEPFTEVLIILAVVLLNAVLGVIQESKAEAAIEALQTMTAATSKVLRDGAVAELESSRLVPGDVVLLEAGDAVPADGRLLACASLQIEEAALTGESVPSAKSTDPLTGDVPWGIAGTWPTWAPPFPMAGAAWWSPPPEWTRRWARSPVSWPGRSRRRRRCKEADPAGQDAVLAGAGHLRVHFRV